MRTKRINVYEAHRRWLQWHLSNADCMECDAVTGKPMRAIYTSPMERWKGLIAPDGTVTVPDMDYYNSLTDPAEMQAVIDELKL